ncbi:MAG: GPW/gp25 family protein [Cyanobacteria bacterium P01_H01_bin.26]
MSIADETAAVEAWWESKVATTVPSLLAAGVDALWWSFRLNGNGAVQNREELDQTIGIILRTARGSDPHRPTFASVLLDYIDQPIPTATPYLIRETLQSLERWEPRIAVDKVAVQPYTEGIASLLLTVDWSIPGSTVEREQTEVAL